jgi:hypothetical protein
LNILRAVPITSVIACRSGYPESSQGFSTAC